MKNIKFTCPVCDYPDLLEEPFHTYEICPQCNIEFGYDDAGRDEDGKPWEIDSSGRLKRLKDLRKKYLKHGSV